MYCPRFGVKEYCPSFIKTASHLYGNNNPELVWKYSSKIYKYHHYEVMTKGMVVKLFKFVHNLAKINTKEGFKSPFAHFQLIDTI